MCSRSVLFGRTATDKSPEEETPAETVAPGEAKTAAAPVESREPVGIRLDDKASSIRGKIADAIDSVKPQLRRARKGDSNSADKEKSNAEEPRKLNPVDPLKIVSKTKAALDSLRERLKAEDQVVFHFQEAGSKNAVVVTCEGRIETFASQRNRPNRSQADSRRGCS